MLLVDAEPAQQRGIERGVAEPDAIALQAGGVQRVAQHGRAPRRCPRRRGRRSARSRPAGTRASARGAGATLPVGVGDVAEAQRRLGRLVARGHHARDRHRHVRAQRQHVAVVVDHPVGRLHAAVAAAQDRLVLDRGRVDLAVAGSSKTPRSASVIARSSRISSGSTSRVPLGMRWITPRAGSLATRSICAAELAQALVDALVAAVDLADVADLAAPSAHSAAISIAMPARMSGDSRRPPRSRLRPGDDRAVRIAQDDVGAHDDQLVGEDHAVLEHPLVDQHRAAGTGWPGRWRSRSGRPGTRATGRPGPWPCTRRRRAGRRAAGRRGRSRRRRRARCCRPRRSNTRRIMRRSSGSVSLTRARRRSRRPGP